MQFAYFLWDSLEQGYYSETVSRSFLEPLNKKADLIFEALAGKNSALRHNDTALNCLALIPAIRHCQEDVTELAPTYEFLCRQLIAECCAELGVETTDWNEINAELNFKFDGLGLREEKLHSLFLCVPEVLSYFLYDSSKRNKAVDEFFVLANDLSGYVYAALEFINRLTRSKDILEEEWTNSVNLTIYGFLSVAYTGQLGAQDPAEDPLSVFKTAGAMLDQDYSVLVSHQLSFQHAILLASLVKTTLLNVESELRTQRAETIVGELVSLTDVVELWKELHGESFRNDTAEWFIMFCNQCMPAPWEPTDVLYKDDKNLDSAARALALLKNKNSQILDVCNTLRCEPDEIENVLTTYLTTKSGTREEDIKNLLPQVTEYSEDLRKVLEQARAVIKFDGFTEQQYHTLVGLLEVPNDEYVERAEQMLGDKLTGFMREATIFLRSQATAQLEETPATHNQAAQLLIEKLEKLAENTRIISANTAKICEVCEREDNGSETFRNIIDAIEARKQKALIAAAEE